MIARIAKRFTFDAAHFLPGLAPDHPCSRMHGHTYRVELQLVGPVDHRGFVVDYADIAQAWKIVRELVDHRVLNEVPGLTRPTTEFLASWIVEKLASHPMFAITIAEMSPSPGGGNIVTKTKCTLLERVIVHESATTWCEVLVGDIHHELGQNKVPKPAANTVGLYNGYDRQ